MKTVLSSLILIYLAVTFQGLTKGENKFCLNKVMEPNEFKTTRSHSHMLITIEQD